MLNGFKSYNLIEQEIEYRDYLSISENHLPKTQLIIAAGLHCRSCIYRFSVLET